MNYVIAFFVVCGLLYFIGVALYEILPVITVGLYREIKYGRHGICWKCKMPFDSVITRQASQMYGDGRIVQYDHSKCGTRCWVHGNRRHLDW